MVVLTGPAVALFDVAVTGSLPPAAAVLAAAAVAGCLGMLLPERSGTPALAFVLAGAQVAGHATAALLAQGPAGGCLPAVGRGAELGVRLALLSPHPACPPGSFAIGGLSGAVLAAIGAALAIVAGQVLVAGAGGLLVATLELTWAAARTLGALLGRVPAAVRLPVPPRPGLVTSAAPPAPRRPAVPAGLRHRGPPALGPA